MIQAGADRIPGRFLEGARRASRLGRRHLVHGERGERGERAEDLVDTPLAGRTSGTQMLLDTERLRRRQRPVRKRFQSSPVQMVLSQSAPPKGHKPIQPE